MFSRKRERSEESGETRDPRLQADDRTRQVPRVEDHHLDHDHDDVVEVPDRPSYSVITHEPPASVLAVRKAQQVVWYLFGVLETLLALRFILLAVGANPANPFFAFVRDLTNPLVYPFANLVETPRVGVSTLEFGTIFAMVIYILVALAIAKLLELAILRDS